MRPRVWKLRQVVPGLLIAAFLMDFASRFVSIDPLTFRGWEALTRNRPPGAAFEPDRSYSNGRSYGDLASLGNLPQFRQYRSERFTTDALGFRNSPHVLNEDVSAILAGDSFAVGSGVDDDEMLSSRLSTSGGCLVYNAGSDQSRVIPEEVLALARRLHLRNRLLIRLYSEDAQLPSVIRDASLPKRVMNIEARTPAAARRVVGRLRGFIEVSPLQMLSSRALKAVADDRILPNRYAPTVVRATLYNGDAMLFLASSVDNFYRRREVAMDYWRWLRDELRAAHVDLMVVIVPAKYTVYRPYLIAQPTIGHGGSDYLDRLTRALEREGIPVLNLTPVLSTEAARELTQGKYLYWRDDVHWNAQGIALAAEAIRNSWPLSKTSCGTPFSVAGRMR